MKSILVILDGVSEEKITTLNNKTPLEYAITPTLNKIIKKGIHSKKKFYIEDRAPDSLSCILSILGIGESKIPKNRAYLEAIAAGIKIEGDEAALRCNLISVKDNLLESFNGKGLAKEEMYEIAKSVKLTEDVRFYHMSDYRNILVLKKNSELLSLTTMPPHENLGFYIDDLLSDYKKIEVLNEFISCNQFIFRGRQYMFYPWGVSESVVLPSFNSIHNKTCSCVCSAEIVKGIAKAMKMDLPVLKNATGDVDTDLKEKARTVLNEIKNHDVIFAHINGTDEVSHRMDVQGKVNFIEKIDKEFLKEIYEESRDIQLIVLSDHQTSSITGKHEKGLVDYITNIREK